MGVNSALLTTDSGPIGGATDGDEEADVEVDGGGCGGGGWAVVTYG